MNDNNEGEAFSLSESNDTDLDAFEAEFFGQNEPEPTPASVDEPESEETDDSAPEDDDTQSDDDTVDTEEEDEPEAPKEKPKKKNSVQERINEAVGKQRNAERERDALQAELEKLRNKATEPTPTPEKADDKPTDTMPKPDDVNEDGTEKYPLGEWDPAYNRAVTAWSVKQELEAYKAEQAQKDAEAAEDAESRKALEALQSTWTEQRNAAQERYPDFEEKGLELVDTFGSIEPQYGEYLSQTIMSMDHGADVLYYLANNLDVAQEIVDMGARKATIALGRLEAQFSDVGEKEPSRKVTKAPTPPPSNRGSAVARPAVPVDTDDLRAFEQEFYKKK